MLISRKTSHKKQSGQAHFNSPIPLLMRDLHALRAEHGQLLLTASAHASAHPPGGFYDIGKYKLSYIIKNTGEWLYISSHSPVFY